MIMNLYRYIDREKVQFDFVISTRDECDYTKEIESLGGRIYSIPRFNMYNAIKYPKAWHKFLSEHSEYKIIHGHLRSTASIYLKIAKRYGLITIAHSHNTSSGTGLPAIVKNILQRPIRYIADYLFACSEYAGVWLFGEEKCKKDNFFIVNNAVDAKKFIYNESIRLEMRKRLQIENKFVIGHVGRFHPAKNHEFLIDVFKELHKKNKQAILLMCGDGELRIKIEKKVSELGLEHCVMFTGVRADIPELLQAIDVFLLPSLYEGLPVSVIEAQGAGLPCIISDTISKEADITNLIEYFSLDNTIEEWADKILIYANGFKRRNTYDEIKSAKYDINDTVKWFEEFYSELSEVF
jgi:glycosyltransferase involved in cell wall biosynthesis